MHEGEAVKVWERAIVDVRCGLCGAPIPRGTPCHVYVFPYVEKVRCATCAGEAPPELPALPVRQPEPPPALPFVRFGPSMLPLDFKQRQAKDEDDA